MLVASEPLRVIQQILVEGRDAPQLGAHLLGGLSIRGFQGAADGAGKRVNAGSLTFVELAALVVGREQ
jgi:hypothetical protein